MTDGPFANNTRIYWEGNESPHCLSRGFKHFETKELGKISGYWFRPEQMGELKTEPTYIRFEDKIEGMMHNSLHWGVRGDFSSMTAANEPLFFLHHTKIDKLWWQWQSEDFDFRKTEYEGVSFNTTEGRARQGTIHDTLEFMDLWRDTKVSEVMETQNELLCYRY